MEFGKLPFHRRFFVGLGFLVVGAAGVIGAFEQGVGSFTDGQAAAHAADSNDSARAAWFRQRRAERPAQSIVDGVTGLLSLGAAGYLMRDGWKRFMRIDGGWAFEVPPPVPDTSAYVATQPSAQTAITEALAPPIAAASLVLPYET